MNIGLLSDSHLSPKTWQADLPAMLPVRGSVDVMILLGDIGHWSQIPDICQAVQLALQCQVIFVPGNHDYYSFGSNLRSMVEIRDFWHESLANNDMITVLIDQSVDIGDVSFFGSTWWSKMGSEFDRDMFRLSEHNFSDFSYIIQSWVKVGEQHLPNYLRSGDLPIMNATAKTAYSSWQMKTQKKKVFCAHFPMFEALRHPKFSRSPYFVSEDDDWMLYRMPDMVLFGHTHWNIREQVHDIPCISNMFGYQNESGLVGFEPHLVIPV
jgi:predicted phosphodiesterase